MTGIKISGLPAVPSAQTTDYFPVVQAGVTSRETLDQVATLFGMSGGIQQLANGGTSAALTADNGAIVYSTATALALLAHTATAGKVLQSGSAAAPSWSTPTYPSASGTAGKVLRSDGTNNVYSTSTFADTYAINTILYNASANTVSGLATANSGVLITSAGGVPSISSTLPSAVQGNITSTGTIASGTWHGSIIGAAYGGTGLDGSAAASGTLPIGNGTGFSLANITAGAGITVSNGVGTIQITASGTGAFNWTTVVAATQSAAVNNGYVANRGTAVTFTLPGTAAVGDEIDLLGLGAGGWILAQPAGVQVHFGSSATTVGVGGSIASTNQYDNCFLICTVANTTWSVYAAVGNLTVV